MSPVPKFDPKKAELHDLEPAIKEIIDGFLKLALPESKYEQAHGRDAIGWSMVFRERLPDCCAYHRMEWIAHLENDMVTILNACMHDECDQTITHEFIAEMISIISKAMRHCVSNLIINQMLDERRN